MMPDRMTAARMIRGRDAPTTRSVPTTRARTGQTTSPFRQTISSRNGPFRRTTRRRTGLFRPAISSPIRSRAGQLIRCPTVVISRTSSRSQGQTSRRLLRLQIETGRTSARGSRAATLLLRTGRHPLNTTLRLSSGRPNATSARLRLRSKTGSTRRLHLSSGRHNVRSAPRLRRSSTRLRRNVHNRSMRTVRRLRRVRLNGRGRTPSLRRRQGRSRTTSQIKNRRRTKKRRSPTKASKAEAAAYREMCGGLPVSKLGSAAKR